MTHHEETAGIRVLGVGELTATPDRMTIELAISPRASSVNEAASVAADKTTSLLEVLGGLGVDPADIRTSRYSINPEYDHRDGGQRLLGFRVTNSLQVTVRDLDEAGALIDAAVNTGGDDLTVNNISYSIEDETELRHQAREKAWANALAQAEHLATLSGRRLGPVSAIVTGGSAEPGPVARMAGFAESTPIAPGSSIVRVTLDVRFALD
jgi:uncharacterized protein YggE